MHASLWNVIQCNTILPLLVLAFWSGLWFGWYALVPVTIALLWTWYNPRIFPAPKSFDTRASKVVFGERVWLNRDVVPVPVHHLTAPNILSTVSGIGILFIFWGVFAFDLWPTLFGTTLVYCGKP